MDAKPIVLKSDGSSSPFLKPKLNLKIVGLVIVILVLLLGVGAGVYLIEKGSFPFRPKAANEAAELYFNPASLDVTPGGEFETEVFINTKDISISAAQLSVKYDSEYLSLLSFDKDVFLENKAGQTQSSPGNASMTLLATPPNTKKGTAGIAKLKFRGLKQTSTPTEISFDPANTKVISPDVSGNTISGLQKALITIGLASSSATATPTNVASSSAKPTLSKTKYDFNADGKVNSLDLSFMYANWGAPKSEVGKKADLNGDGVVNGVDFSMLLREFSQ